MIRRGKTEGWLQLPQDAFLSWANFNEVTFDRTVSGSVPGRGGALLAKEDLNANEDMSNVLLTVPTDLILSLERVQEHAKVDKDFREVIESLGDFGRTARGAILSLLLEQASVSCPDLPLRVGVHTPFTDYIKSLPLELLPTFWTSDELNLLMGTTLAPAVSAKLKSLRREYDLLCTSAAQTRWYQTVQNYIDFDDWLHVDAMYRSRALEMPGIGHCMVPCVDLANHASGDATVASYEKHSKGNAVLLLRDGKEVSQDGEVTITYGDEKGACEMIFSYGFLEDSMESAESLFLSLTIPDNDKFRAEKARIGDCAPGFKLIDTGDSEIDWTGDFIWLLCVNEDDGLRFEIARTVDGKEEVGAFFRAAELSGGAAGLHSLLQNSDLWDVYKLRAVMILQQRVFDQLQLLYATQEDMEVVEHGGNTDIRDGPYHLAMTLRRLEFDLQERAYEVLEAQFSCSLITAMLKHPFFMEADFESKKIELAQSPVVVRYLAEQTVPEPIDQDFS